MTEECGLGSSSDHGEQSSINSGGESGGHLRDSTGEMASEEGHENDSSDNGEQRPQSDTSPNLFLKFRVKLEFLEFLSPRIFLHAMFCLEIFSPGILFHGK